MSLTHSRSPMVTRPPARHGHHAVGSIVAVMSLLSWRMKRKRKIEMHNSLYVELQDCGTPTLGDRDGDVQDGRAPMASPARHASSYSHGNDEAYSPGGSLKHRSLGASRA